MSTDKVRLAVEESVAVVTLDDAKANALSFEVIEGLHGALDRAAEEASALLIVGRPGRFSAGFDLATMTASPESAQKLVTAGAELLMRIYLHPQPVVAACTGHALAAGALLLCVCDRRIGAAGDFKIGLNEVAIGLRLPVFGVELARDRLSKRHLTAATTLGRVYTPSEACDAGFLDATVAAEEVIARARAEAIALAKLPHGAHVETKRTLRTELVERVRATLAEDMARFVAPTQAGRG